MPYTSGNYNYTPLTLADFQGAGTPTVPTFQQFAGTSLPNLMDTLANLKIRVQEPGLRESARQYDLANALQNTVAGQNYNLGMGQLSNQLTLGQGEQANQIALAQLQDALERARLGEAGRQFDFSGGLTKDQQAFEQGIVNTQLQRQQEQYDYLKRLLGSPGTSDAAVYALTGYKDNRPQTSVADSIMSMRRLFPNQQRNMLEGYTYPTGWPT